jgi:hypothetical protein
MRHSIPAAWPEPERRIVDRYVREVIQGRFESVNAAARACLDELRRLRATGRYVLPPKALRTIAGVRGAIWRSTHAARFHGLNTRWTPPEDRVIVRYARALIRRRYGTVHEAARECAREFERLRAGRSGTAWAAVPRNLKAIESRLYRRALAAGHVRWRFHLTPVEQAVYDRYARALADGRYRDVTWAARACLKVLGRLRRQGPAAARTPSRTLSSVCLQLSARAQKLGWSWVASRWRPEERRILDRHVRALAGREHPAIHLVARDCFNELVALYKRRRAEEPALRLAFRPRTFRTILTYLLRWSREKGRTVLPAWSPQEDKIVGRFARALIEARFADAPTAARACRLELTRLRRLWRTDDPTKLKGTRPRSLAATYSHLCKLAHRLNQRWPKTAWTDAEMKVCRQWIRWYDKHRGVRRLKTWDTVAEGMQEELERMNSRRSFSACQSKFWKEWRRVRGYA